MTKERVKECKERIYKIIKDKFEASIRDDILNDASLVGLRSELERIQERCKEEAHIGVDFCGQSQEEHIKRLEADRERLLAQRQFWSDCLDVLVEFYTEGDSNEQG